MGSSKPPSHFSVLFWNCHSLHSKLDQLNSYAEQHRPHIIALAEAWLDPVDQLTQLHDALGYSRISLAHQRNSGGLVFFVKSFLKPKERTDLSVKIENSGILWIEVRLLSDPNPFLVAVAYRTSPRGPITTDSPDHWSAINSSILNTIKTNPKHHVIITGDFNAHHDSWDNRISDSHGNKIHHLTNSTDLVNLNCIFAPYEPTFPSAPSTIDLILCNCPHLVEDMRVETEQLLVSDHYPLLLTLKRPVVDPTIVSAHSKWNIDKADWGRYESALESLSADWLRNISVDASVDDLHKSLMSLIQQSSNSSVPTKNIRPSTKSWFSPSLMRTLRIYHRAKNRYYKRKDHTLRPAYLLARSTWKREALLARRLHNERTCERLADPKNGKLVHKIWKQISKPPPTPLNPSSADDFTNLGNFFANTMSDRANTNSDHLITNLSIRHIAKEASTQTHPLDLSFTVDEVGKQCRTAKASTAAGLDNIHPEFLRHTGPNFHASLCHLFNQSWARGTFPSEWKRSKAVALFKGKGSRDDPTNYRLICITSIISRTFEHIVFNRLYSYLSKRRFFDPGQAGFRKGFATTDNLFRLQQSVYSALRKTSHLPVAFLDISKAFDTVWHNGLLKKLQDKAKIGGRAWLWLRSFLSDRSFCIVDKGTTSCPFFTTAGVPQGCVLSPLLFLIYINDLPSELRQVVCLLYADDIALYPIKAGPLGHVHLTAALRAIHRWAVRWKIVFSSDKSQIVCFNNKQYHTVLPSFSLGSVNLQRVEEYKYLGLILQANGKWDKQFSSLCLRLHRSIFAIQRLIATHSAPSPPVLLQLMAAPMAQLEYGLALWRPNQTQFDRLLSIIVKPFRRYLSLPACAHRDSVFAEFGLLSIANLRRKCILQLASRILRLPSHHPSQQAWLLDSVPSGSVSQIYCRPFAQEVSEVARLVGLVLPTTNPIIADAVSIYNTKTYLRSSHGRALKQIRSLYGDTPPYFNTSIFPLRLRARLRFDLAPLNYSLHKRNLAPSALCACGTSDETRDHVLLECPAYDSPRRVLFSSLLVECRNAKTILDAISPESTTFILEIQRIRHLIRPFL